MTVSEEILITWASLDQLAHDLLVPIQTEEKYEAAMNLVELVWNKVGQDANSPYMSLLQLLGSHIQAYEERAYPVGSGTPRDTLEFLMDQNGLKQKDLGDIAPQSVISEILSGKRLINGRIAKALGERFKVSTDVFL